MDTAIQQSFINPVINREKGEFIQFSRLRKSFKEGGQMRVPCKNLYPKHSLE